MTSSQSKRNAEPQSDRAVHASVSRARFLSVMTFLDSHGYHVADSDGDWAYHGGHRQRALAEAYGEWANR